jgi:hypothetical protein
LSLVIIIMIFLVKFIQVVKQDLTRIHDLINTLKS